MGVAGGAGAAGAAPIEPDAGAVARDAGVRDMLGVGAAEGGSDGGSSAPAGAAFAAVAALSGASTTSSAASQNAGTTVTPKSLPSADTWMPAACDCLNDAVNGLDAMMRRYTFVASRLDSGREAYGHRSACLLSLAGATPVTLSAARRTEGPWPGWR